MEKGWLFARCLLRPWGWRRASRSGVGAPTDCSIAAFLSDGGPRSPPKEGRLRRYSVGGRALRLTMGAWTLGPLRSMVPLDHVERYALVHEEACKRMPQIVEPNVEQTRTPADAIPGVEQGRKPMSGDR